MMHCEEITAIEAMYLMFHCKKLRETMEDDILKQLLRKQKYER